ncbi:hypothetical protein [Spartinivicinus poritis]|uniref:Uncharacterized protein n=1 Tax=Spartinivicinus poritis TaxID=2994640 RepID=A0ABT5UH10_9GAMM|nr:hypothetical protein [Spartinivicinus sp. A2-2]MDE1465679.1 hypothetical protein [Spartinivicinus sp. A2-2]
MKQKSILKVIIILLIFHKNTFAATEQYLSISRSKNVTLKPGFTAVCENTSNGSPSLVVVYNMGNRAANVAFFLGAEHHQITVPPGTTSQFPENGPKIFEGLTLRVSNISIDGTSEIAVNLFSLGDCSQNSKKIKK